MNQEIIDWLALIFRFVHVLAAIMWIGESIFFMWLDHSIVQSDDSKEQKKSQGTLWMIHGGGIFHVNKRILKPVEIPKSLHWFKWQSYTTWLSGFCLILFTFYLKGGKMLLHEDKLDINPVLAVHIGLGYILVSWFIYDLIWRSPIRKNSFVGSVISMILLIVSVWGISQIFNGRTAFLHVGAMLGTIMTANVFFHIIPNQRKMMKALMAGKDHDLELSKKSKQRSTHNNYMTFPVLFMMLSMHFPQAHGSNWNWIVLTVFIVGLATIRHFINIRFKFSHWLASATGVFIICGFALWFLTKPKTVSTNLSASEAGTELIELGKSLYKTKACFTCHDQHSSVKLAPPLDNVFNSQRMFTDKTWAIADEDYLRESIIEPQKKIVNGFQPTMTPYKALLKENEVKALIEYIKSLKK